MSISGNELPSGRDKSGPYITRNKLQLKYKKDDNYRIRHIHDLEKNCSTLTGKSGNT